MSHLSRRFATATATVVLAALAFGGTAAAQSPAAWDMEDVAVFAPAPPATGCVFGMTLAGFDHDPSGRPVLAWREENDCGGPPDVFWSRKDGGTWTKTQFVAPGRYDGGARDGYSHQMALRPSDGEPFIVYRDVVPGNSLTTFQTDLGTGAATYLEYIIGPQSCGSASYAVAFAPGSVNPDWATGIRLCNDGGPVRLDGALVGSAYRPLPALAVTPDGTRHVLWTSGEEISYARWGAGDASPTTGGAPLFSNVNRFGGEVALASDAAGVLHAGIRGPEGQQADWDQGAVGYIESTDGGHTWTPFEYVDTNDAVPNSIGINNHISLALDPAGNPAMTWWRGNVELWFARRDAGGVWTRSLIASMPNDRAPRGAQVDFDAQGNPVVAFYDFAARKMRLARPAVTNHSPLVTSPGDQVSAEGATVSLPVSASDADGDALTYAATGLPAGLVIDPATGVISGHVAFLAAGDHPVVLSVDDGATTSTAGFTWSVSNVVCNPLALPDSATTPMNAAVGIHVLDNDVLPAGCVPFGAPTFAGLTQPQHGSAVLDGKLSIATYTPAAGFTGIDTFTYTITNTDGGSATATVTVTVQPRSAPVVQPLADRVSVAGVPLSVPVVAASVPPGGALNFSAAGLPAGLSINATSGLITGSPSAAAASRAPARVVVTVRDTFGASGQAAFAWRITLANGADLAISASVVAVATTTVLSVEVTDFGARPVFGAAPALVALQVPSRWSAAAWTCNAPSSPAGARGAAVAPAIAGHPVLRMWMPSGQSVRCTAQRADNLRAVDVVAGVLSPLGPVDPYVANNVARASLTR